MFKKSYYKPWQGYLFLVVMGVGFIIGLFQWFNQDENGQMEEVYVILTQETCTDAGGVWNDCGSACRGQDADACIQVCTPQCECTKENDCPFGYECSNPINGIGICQKQ